MEKRQVYLGVTARDLTQVVEDDSVPCDVKALKKETWIWDSVELNRITW